MGGLVCIRLAARMPELVAALVLLDPALPAPPRVLRPLPRAQYSTSVGDPTGARVQFAAGRGVVPLVAGACIG